MLPIFPEFKPLDLSMRDEIAKYLQQHHATICELALGNLYAWAEIEHLEVTTINGNLCFLFQPGDEPPYFAEPIGDNLIAATVDICLQYCGRVARVSEKFLPKLASNNHYQITPVPALFDYVYQTIALAELKGQDYDGKRNHIHKFESAYPDFQYKIISPAFAKSALEIFRQWTLAHGDRAGVGLPIDAQKNALTNVFKYFQDFAFTGGFIQNQEQPLGFILGSPLNADTFVVHFQYGLKEAPGVYQVLLQRLCAQLATSFTYINLEQDLGVAGLRKMKTSYHPLRLEKKYELLANNAGNHRD
jgi:uncharacterized protein